MKGPVPIASWSTFSGVPAFIIASAYSLDWIEAQSSAAIDRKATSRRFSFILTVRSSTFVTLSSRSPMPRSAHHR